MLPLFTALLAKLLPLYGTMGSGFALNRVTGDITKSLATLQIYFLTPLVIVTNVMNLNLQPNVILLPGIMFTLCVIAGTLTRLGTRMLKVEAGPAMAQAAGTCNAGYLGIPVAMILFPADILPLYIIGTVATSLYENSVGYYFLARGRFSAKDALRRLLSLPTVYALALGLFLAAFEIRLPEAWEGFARDLRGAYVILGALIIGFGLVQVKNWRFDFAFIGSLLAIKHIAWPLVMFTLVVFEQNHIGYLSHPIQACLLLMSMMPLAANSAAFAALLGIASDKMATSVAVSTVLGLVTIPLTAILFGFTG